MKEKYIEEVIDHSLVKIIGEPEAAAEAYLFCMKYVFHVLLFDMLA